MKKKPNLDYKKMVEDVLEIANPEYTEDLEWRAKMPRQKPFTQKEAKQMARELSSIWFICHCLTCENCQKKYVIKK
jgi:hypothetical protein